MRIAYDWLRLGIYVAALAWMVWFARAFAQRVRRAALLFCGGILLEVASILIPWGRGQRPGIALSNVGMILVLGSTFLIILELSRSSQRHKRDAEIDHLTGLFNRRVFFGKARDAMEEARLGNTRLAVAVLDVDNMKEINDLYGHQCGDEVLRHAARAIELSVRRDDVAARHGGDEFAILFRDSGPHLTTLRERLEEYLQGVSACEGAVRVGLSVGLAIYPADGQNMDDLIHVADFRMYADKAMRKHHREHIQPPQEARDSV